MDRDLDGVGGEDNEEGDAEIMAISQEAVT
jgi:hypothetical protein